LAYLELRNLDCGYGAGAQRREVLRDVNLAIDEREFVAVLGFSGSGKTTLIAAIAGLLAPSQGEVLLQGERIAGPGADRGVVFQSYSLLPWLTVFGNVALAVNATFADWTSSERRAQVHKYIKMVGLSHALDRRPAELSGGMRQRVAVARALAMQPQILLLDEPLSALDALTRGRLQHEIEAIWENEKRTVVLVTNDVDEALLLADRIVTLTPGPVATLGREFAVPLARPRDRSGVNHDPVYRALRAEITGYLSALGQSGEPPADSGRRTPSAVPVTSNEFAPQVLQAAIRTKPATNLDKFVEFYNVAKIYPTLKGTLTVVEDFSLNIRKGEMVSLIGHSGCGKSTVLSMVAGLTDVSGGGIAVDGREIVAAGPDRGVVFQSPNLLPWLTARENVALGVNRVYPHIAGQERREIVEYYLARVGLADAMDRRASELSNGMRQRVGLARAFALSPKLLLLDEPFGMLDALTRWELQEVLMDIWRRTRITTICVTHDVDEAILLADRIVMMTNGPQARIGRVMPVELPQPRTRQALLAHPRYYEYREAVLSFLSEYEHQPATKAA
jgi:nitrate/nitrite transport system ATP-binding protein